MKEVKKEVKKVMAEKKAITKKLVLDVRNNSSNVLSVPVSEIRAHLKGVPHVSFVEIAISTKENLKFSFDKILNLSKERFFATNFHNVAFLLLVENKIKCFVKDVTLTKQSEYVKRWNFKNSTKKESQLNWLSYYNTVLKFKYCVELKGKLIFKLPKAQNILIVDKKALSAMKSTDLIEFKRIN